MTVQIAKIIERSSQGMTKPFICKGDDAQIYFVKSRGAGRRNQICEWVAGLLGRELSLPIAEFEIIDVLEFTYSTVSAASLPEFRLRSMVFMRESCF